MINQGYLSQIPVLNLDKDKIMPDLKLMLSFASIGLYLLIASAQSPVSLQAKAAYGFKNEDAKILAQLEGIDHYKVTFKPQQLSGSHYFSITTKEYLKGKVIKSEELIPEDFAKQYYRFKNIDSNTTITLTTKPQGDSVLFLFNTLNRGYLPRKYMRLKRDTYSLRDGLVTNEGFKSVPLNTTLPLFAYSLPYVDPKQPNVAYYCAITADGVPPEKWWETKRIEHYIIVELKIVSL